MGIRLPSVILSNAKQVLKLQNKAKNQSGVPKGHVAVYVGELEKKRFMVPITYLSHTPFVDLLKRAEEEYGFHHPMGALTIPCREDAFISITSQLNAL